MVTVRTLFSLAGVWTIPMLLTTAYADVTSPERSGEKQFSDRVQVEYADREWTLVQTGQTVRRQYFLRIYAMAHYLEGDLHATPGSTYRAIIDAPGIKQITMRFLRNLSADQIQQSLASGLRASAGAEQYARILPDVERFMRAINDDARRDTEFVLRWYPDGTLESFYRGSRISSIRNAEFASVMWSIWFGENSVVDRAALVERL